MGKDFGAESCCFGEHLLSEHQGPVGDLRAGCSHCPPSTGAGGVQDQAGVLQQWVQRAFEAKMDAWLMSHVRWSREGEEGWGKAPKGFPALCKGPVPSHASWVPVPPPPLTPLSRPAGTAGCGEKQGCGHCVQAAWHRILPACALAWCLPTLNSTGSGEEDPHIQAWRRPVGGL